MANLSTEITGKIRSCLFVLSALFQQGPAVVDILMTKVMTTLSEGEEPPDLLTQVRTLGHILKAELDRMVELDKELVRESRLRAELLRRRDDLVSKLAVRVRGVRLIITGLFVAPDVARLGLEGTLSREPVALIRQAEQVTEQLRGDDLDEMLGDPLFDPRHDPRPYGPQVDSFIAGLREAHDAHQWSKRRVDELLEGKSKAVADYDIAFVRVTRQFEDLCRMAGKTKLADKVRPSATRKGETAVEPEGDEVPETSDEAVGVAGEVSVEGEQVTETVEETASEPATEPDAESISDPVQA